MLLSNPQVDLYCTLRAIWLSFHLANEFVPISGKQHILKYACVILIGKNGNKKARALSTEGGTLGDGEDMWNPVVSSHSAQEGESSMP